MHGRAAISVSGAGGGRGEQLRQRWGRRACGDTAACACDRSRCRKARGWLGQGMTGVSHRDHRENLAPKVRWGFIESAF